MLTKPVLIEGTLKFFPSKFFIVLHISAAIRVYVVRKWPLSGRSRFVLEYHTVSLWLLCNVHFVQNIRPYIAT